MGGDGSFPLKVFVLYATINYDVVKTERIKNRIGNDREENEQ